MPAPRRRGLAALRLEEREEISRGIAVGRSALQWSPAQISGWLKQQFPTDQRRPIDYKRCCTDRLNSQVQSRHRA